MRTMRVYVTENCNANCSTCFNANSRTKDEISPQKFELLCKWLSENGIKNLKVMGGEPTVHSEFKKIIKIAQNNFKNVYIFTNGINGKIKNINLRENDSIVFNFTFNNLFTKESLCLDNDGSRCFEVQIHKNTNEIQIVSRIIELYNLSPNKIHISLTLDCTSNIFLEREIIVKKLQYIESELIKNKIHFSYDHKIPFCYLYKTNLHPTNNGQCEISATGLIGADLTLRFCNQHTERLISIYQDEKFIPWNIFMNRIYEKYYEIQMKNLNKICKNCVFYNNHCNGGCWISSKKISRDDILKNTDFPIK